MALLAIAGRNWFGGSRNDAYRQRRLVRHPEPEVAAQDSSITAAAE